MSVYNKGMLGVCGAKLKVHTMCVASQEAEMQSGQLQLKANKLQQDHWSIGMALWYHNL